MSNANGWDTTKDVVLLGRLPSRIADEKDEEKRAKLEAQLLARQSDPRFAIKVKAVGTPEQPTLLAQIEARHRKALHVALKAAREELLPMGEEAIEFVLGAAKDGDDLSKRTMATAIFAHAYVSAEMQAARDVRAKELILHGVVGGAARYHELFALGGRLEGAALLLEAASAVEAFNKLEDDTGNV